MQDLIKVDYKVYSTSYSIKKNLPLLLANNDVLSFDVECRSLYNKEERAAAKEYLKEATTSDVDYKQARVVANSSGLSFPSIVKTTHFIFAADKHMSYIFVCDDEVLEQWIWEQIVDYKGKYLIHNTLFDLKLCYQRTGKLPKSYVDTMLMVKCLLNHVNIWQSKTGLKELVGNYYPTSWSLYDNYEPVDLKDPKFIKYCSYDGSATFLVYGLILEEYGHTAQ